MGLTLSTPCGPLILTPSTPYRILILMRTVDEAAEKRERPALAEDDILGLTELADRWHVTKQRVAELTEKRLPHWRRLACGRIWRLSDVQEFEKNWTRLSGIHVTPKDPPEDEDA